MGTFIIRPTVQDSGGTPQYNSGALPFNPGGWCTEDYPTTPLLDVIKDTSPTPNALQVLCGGDTGSNAYSDTLRLSFTGNCIFLDGSPTPISFAGLPSGFTVLTASVEIRTDPSGVQPGGGVAQFFLQQGPSNDGTVNTNSFPYSSLAILHIVSSGIGLKVNFTAPMGTAPGIGPAIYDFRVEGTYELQGFIFTLQVPNEPVNTGDEITVTSGTLDLDQVTDIDIEYTDENGDPQIIPVTVIRKQNSNTLIFIMPDLNSIGAPPGIIIITIHSTQFSGSVTLGKLITIYFLNAPGIYTLVAGKSNDTLYDIENGGTVDVKIPNPFGKVGFVGN